MPRWGMVIDLAKCTACQACVVACQSENNVTCVEPSEAARGRILAWLSILASSLATLVAWFMATLALLPLLGAGYIHNVKCRHQDTVRRGLEALVQHQQPKRAGTFRPKLRYAHQGGMNPPRIIIHGNALEHVPESYRRYLERFFREAFKLRGTPLAVEFKTGRNPYVRGGR